MNNINLPVEILSTEKNIKYSESIKFMQKRVDDILNHKKTELIWFLNHNHIYTCGTSANKNEILKKTNIPIIKTNRGGKTTYHGPGQRIIYLMINLNKRKKDIRKFIKIIESTTIDLLKNFKIESRSFPERIGIWVTKVNGKALSKEKKIAAIGLRLKKWITYHGLSFNISPNLNYYENINPCGLSNYSVTSLKELNIELSKDEFDKLFIKIINSKLKKF